MTPSGAGTPPLAAAPRDGRPTTAPAGCPERPALAEVGQGSALAAAVPWVTGCGCLRARLAAGGDGAAWAVGSAEEPALAEVGPEISLLCCSGWLREVGRRYGRSAPLRSRHSRSRCSRPYRTAGVDKRRLTA
ncbi:hypothetical protein GCM10010243_24060 [Streptomyces matensis]|nr:hypothetical protein GCM10010243_24060 [Streptomyces matensis]